jgi:hypothetical protein
VAETDRRASAELRKKAAPKKQEAVQKSGDLSSLRNAFGVGPGKLSTTLDQYNRYVLVETDVDGQEYVRYLFVDPNGRDWERLNGTEAIKKVKEAYRDQNALREVLYQKGFLSEREYESKSVSALNGAILQAATEFSTEIADSYTTEGKIKFPTFQNWVSGRGDIGEEDRGPRRDIQKYDRDVIRKMVVDAYLDSPNANLPEESIIERDTDRYMKMANEGTLTKSKKKNKAGEFEVVSTPGFSERRLRDEIQKKRQTEFPESQKTTEDLNFLAFLAQLEG